MRRNSVVFPIAMGVILFVILALLPAQDSPGQSREKHEGTAPRTSAAKYHAHAEKDGFSLGAELLTKKDVAKAFAAEINSCCLVVQVAVYPKKDEPADLSLFDFTLIESSNDRRIRPESPTTVAAKLESKKDPPGGVDVTTSTGVGYESGTYIDPVTGQPVHVRGVTTSVGVGVSTGGSVPPDIAERDRKIIERELYEKGLPEAKVSIPVAGYLYFLIPKRTKDDKYQLVYNGRIQPLTLPLP